MQLEFRVLDEEIYFDSVEASHEYAKKHPGTVVVRNNNIDKTYNSSIKKKQLLNISPNTILNHLNKHIISQTEAKKDIAMTLYYHALKSKFTTKQDIKANGAVMLVGPTGSGKTFTVQKACEFIDTIFIHVDTSSMTPEGFTGYGIGDLGRDILKLANNNIHKATHCVVFFDEMDKLFNTDNEHSVSVSRQLLRLIEGTEMKLYYTQTELMENPGAIKELDTSNMQFILGGAFQWILDEKVNSKQNSLGFSNPQSISDEKSDDITLDDLYKENIPKELLGRMSSIINLKKLTKDDYYQILTNSESSPLHEFVKKIELHGDKVDISDETLNQVAIKASQSELGTRAIKQTLKSMFKDALFTAPDNGVRTHNITLNH